MATLRDDLLQRDLEAYEDAINSAGLSDMLGAQRIAGTVVRGAVKAGWFADLTNPDAVGDMAAKDVRALMKQINERYEALVTVDPL